VNLQQPSSFGIADVVSDAPASDRRQSMLGETAFHRMIALERKRTERSRKPFLLMLLNANGGLASDQKKELLAKTLSLLSARTRETDATGWYKSESVVGVMFTEIAPEDRNTIVGTILGRVSENLRSNLSHQQFDQVSLSFYIFPDDWDQQNPGPPATPTLYPDVARRGGERKFSSLVKRAMDIAGSAMLLVVLSPVFTALALAIRLSSKGPVFYRQQRIGHYGKPFVLLKFRSMHMDNDAAEHRNYVRQLIAGEAERHPASGTGEGVYKLASDPRITRVGSFLRRASIDELPQLINVLKGDMSLVGPRPPIDYEVQEYDAWHLRRLLEAKPGLTGLWQVSGRSRVSFDDMVRLDLRYARTCTPWLDLKILLQTPKAVIAGDGAV
jgi:lipopolysaccharide/colanic/teichoic acid biosynthesis glycosyltransferase